MEVRRTIFEVFRGAKEKGTFKQCVRGLGGRRRRQEAVLWVVMVVFGLQGGWRTDLDRCGSLMPREVLSLKGQGVGGRHPESGRTPFPSEKTWKLSWPEDQWRARLRPHCTPSFLEDVRTAHLPHYHLLPSTSITDLAASLTHGTTPFSILEPSQKTTLNGPRSDFS
ncbi:hypothetical protein GQ53DRAFT_144167 [Thozetella sp. PMI_491]|nr:hypothetical protein GQ53DRAFT_144167 [Thozetella sp. PMI_491]